MTGARTPVHNTYYKDAMESIRTKGTEALGLPQLGDFKLADNLVFQRYIETPVTPLPQVKRRWLPISKI